MDATPPISARLTVQLERTADEPAADSPPFEGGARVRAIMPYLSADRHPGGHARALPALSRMADRGVPRPTFDWGSLGTFRASAAVVLRVDSIFGTSSAWSYQSPFVPALLPFVLVVLLSIPPLKIGAAMLRNQEAERPQRHAHPALVMVQLMALGGDDSQTFIIGRTFANVTVTTWPFFAPMPEALGSFFAGSATIEFKPRGLSPSGDSGRGFRH
jgi:hypothetical protein